MLPLQPKYLTRSGRNPDNGDLFPLDFHFRLNKLLGNPRFPGRYPPGKPAINGDGLIPDDTDA